MARFAMLIGAVLQQASYATDCLHLGFDSGELHIDNHTVLKCDMHNTEWLLVFDGRIYLSVSLRDEDFISSSAAVYQPLSAEPVVVDQEFLSQLKAGTF